MKTVEKRVFRQGAIAIAVSLLFQPQTLLANPTGAQVVNGAVNITQPNASTLNVTNSPGAIINWQGFSIGAGEVTRFIQQSSSSAVLNRVVGADISSLQGQLLSNGRVFLINPAGILIGPNAMLDTAGFVGSTLNMQNADFLAGKLRFSGDASSGTIINQGWIRTSYGGNVLLVAPHIENSGLIQTPGGELILAAGQKVTVASLEQEGVQFEVQAPTDSVVNVGKLLADGGAVGLFAGTLRHSGDIRATSLSTDATGHVVLKAQGLLEMTDTSVTSVAGAVGGKVDIGADVVMHTGTVDASGANGGNINVTAHNILSAGILNADGTAGTGGSVTVLASGSILQTANAHVSADGAAGAGGAITLQGQQSVYGSGALSATGSATGGTIKVLGDNIVLLAAQVDASGGSGGGTVLVGGDFHGSNADIQNASNTQSNFSTSIRADAHNTGDGGKVVVWSDASTRFAGSISARGGAQAGNGGRVEVSSKENLQFGGLVDAGAPNGTAGTLLLDPKNIVIGSASGGVSVTDLIDPTIGPGNSENFGSNAVILSNGNIVVPSPKDNFAATKAGAVYLFNGSSGAFISTLTGSQASDQVGLNGVTTLTNGNFVVTSLNWANGAATNAGAVTFGNGTTGVSGVVSAANSLVGSTANDQIGFRGVTALTNGNYVVSSSTWSNAGAANAGAVTFGNGTTGVSGVVSPANSLVGSQANDNVGFGFFGRSVTELSNGNYVVDSPGWANGAAANAGAVTFVSGTTPVFGPVSAANSMVGSKAGDMVGELGVTALVGNGNYVVDSRSWNGVGAVTWGSATGKFSDGTAFAGSVSATNSLVGSTAGDGVGGFGVTALTNGNYVVSSSTWRNAGAANAGAATFGNGTTGIVGPVTTANSLVGSTANDQSGAWVTALANGNYLVTSFNWANGAAPNAGAVTFGNGTTGVSGAISAGNSLVGSTNGDQVGVGPAPNSLSIFALTNGNYVVSSTRWSNGGTATNAGAVTFGSGTSGVSGVVSAANSLVGTKANDGVGAIITPLSNGNYVVASPNWNNGGLSSVGAVTFGSGTTGITPGPVSALNSLVGTQSFDRVGLNGVTALTNGNYVVDSYNWADGAVGQVGAVTFGNGTTGIAGPVKTTNSLVGSQAGDRVGSSGVTALTNGNYVVNSPGWANGAASSAGAVTFGNGTSGISGAVSVGNSLVGGAANANVGGGGVTALKNGNYVVVSNGTGISNGAASSVGAVTFGNGTTGTFGAVDLTNSLMGSTTGDSVGSSGVTALSNGNYVVDSPIWINGPASAAGAVTFGSGTTGVSGAVSATNSLVGSTNLDQVGSGGITELSGGRALVRSPFFTNGGVAASGRLQIFSGGGADPVAGATFANNPGADSTITPASITAITNGGTAVTLQANNDITLAAGSDITSTGSGNITLQAGRSIAINSSISSSNAGTIRLTANDTVANGVQAANRDAGAATLTMAPGTSITTSGTGNVFLRINDGTGHDQTTGNLVVANVTGNNVSIIHDGITPNSAILRASDTALITANPSTAGGVGGVFMELENAPGTGASIGTGAAQMRVTATNLDAHYHFASGGIFIDSPAQGLQIGGSPAFIQTGGSIQGVQTASTNGNTGGPISISVNGTLTQFNGTGAPCGPGGGLTGGPICAGPSTGAASTLDVANSVTLRATDMDLTRAVRGNSVVLLPQDGGTIGMAGGTGTLQLSQAEFNQINTAALRIGERVATGFPEPTSSGDITFGGTITGPATSTLEFRTGGSVIASGAATDIATNNNAGITVLAGGDIGATGAGRLKVNPGTGSMTARTLGSGVFLEKSAGDMDAINYGINAGGPVASLLFELATTDGSINMTGITYNGGNVSVIAGGTGPVARNINFSGTGSYTLSSFTLTPNATGSATFNSGVQTFTTPVVVNGAVSLGGGTANFNDTANLKNLLTLTSGVANFNSTSTIANGALLQGGSLGGTGSVTINNGLTWAGGTIPNTNASGVTAVNGVAINAGTPILSGTLSTDTLTMNSGIFTIGTGGVFTLTGPASSIISSGTIADSGTIRLNGTGGLRISNPAALTINPGGLLDFGADASILAPSGVPTITNDGIVRKSAGTSISQIGNSAQPLSFTSTGTIDVRSGTLLVGSGFPANAGIINLAAGTTFSTGGNDLINNGMITGVGTVSLGTGTLTNKGIISPGNSPGTLNVSGNLTLDPSSTLNIELQMPGLTAGTDYDVINVSGVANLGGTLSVTNLPPFAPAVGQNFTIMNYASKNGDFTTKTFPAGFDFAATPNAANYPMSITGVTFSSSMPASNSSSNSGLTDVTNTIVSDQNRMRQTMPDDDGEHGQPKKLSPALQCS